jgi:cytochrome c peroxidase
VATRRVFFHNGVFHRLEDVVRFYAERDTRPQNWYPRGANGVTLKFDDLPLQYQGNVDTQAPFDRHMGDQPALSETDIKDIVVFLNALTDGYAPPTSAEERRRDLESRNHSARQRTLRCSL